MSLVTSSTTFALSSMDSVSTWIATSFGYQLGLTRLGVLYDHSGGVLQGPSFGLEIAQQRKEWFFGAQLEMPALIGLGDPVLMPYLGLILGKDFGTLRTQVGVGYEGILVDAAPPHYTPSEYQSQWK